MNPWAEAFKLEMEVADTISSQALHGVNFKQRDAKFHIHTLAERIINIDKEVVPLLPKMMNKANPFAKPFKLNGQFSAHAQRYADSVGLKREEVGGPFTRLWYTDFDPSKTAKIKEVMLDNGWIPYEWNQKRMDFDARKLKSMCKDSTYKDVISKLSPDDAEVINTLVDGFIEKHFKHKTKPYMQQIILQLGFRRPPSFGDIKKRLISSQFWPTSPKITPESDKWSHGDSKVGKLLADRMQCSHRKSLLQGLVKVVRDDGKIEARANSCATPTARMRHSQIVNIPNSGAFFGKYCRKLFIGDQSERNTPLIYRNKPGDGERINILTNQIEEYNEKKKEWEPVHKHKIFVPPHQDVFVGGDGAGLELRMLTHYLVSVSRMLYEQTGDQRYAKALEAAYTYRDTLLNGDIHSHNQKLAGLPTRNAAKTFIYSFLYGAGDQLLGENAGGDKELGAKMRATFLAECPCIPVLIEWAQDHAEAHGWIPALDGRKLIMRVDSKGKVQTHKALNMLLQSAGSIVIKQATITLRRWNIEQKLECYQVIHMHRHHCACKTH